MKRVEQNLKTSNKKKKALEYHELEARGRRLEVLINLSHDLWEKERRTTLTFNDFLNYSAQNPKESFRDIFQLFYHMLHHYVPEGVDEYESEESIGFKKYDMNRLFVENCDNPFFADRLFANRIMNLAEGFKSGSLKNHIFLFEGPPGSGKSTFLNNLLKKFEEYTHLEEGKIFSTFWRLDMERLGGFEQLKRSLENSDDLENNSLQGRYLEFACPNNDHPILHIPVSYRKKFLEALIPDKEFLKALFHNRKYEWVLKDIPCHVCKSLYNAVLDIVKDPIEVFSMLYARPANYSRQFGEGLSVFNPGDPVHHHPISNPTIQNQLNTVLNNESVNFIYSYLAKTNNGIFALMDIKEHNIERLHNLHGIISDGVHKVDLVEEHIKTLFMGLVNPKDKEHYEKIPSFQDRIIQVQVPYILEYNTEVAIYKKRFGSKIEKFFLPGVLDNFAKVVISTRLNKVSSALKKWIPNSGKYYKYLDKDSLLLKMDIYTGVIPEYLAEDDLKKFTKEVRKEILAESESEGRSGYSGRQSINLFSNFFNRFKDDDQLITMIAIRKFFAENNSILDQKVPDGFISSLIDSYDFHVLQEVKESLYYYNQTQIKSDITNYLFAINFDIGEKKLSPYTGKEIEITEEFLNIIENLILGAKSTKQQKENFRTDVRKEYVTKTLAQEIHLEKKKIEETEQFINLFEKYKKNLKENALFQYLENENFRRAIMDYKSKSFEKYDSRLKSDIERMVNNLCVNFGYNEQGAREICLYTIEKNLAKKYS